MDRPDVFGHVTFCDDVRFETSGKVSYIGVYDAIMFIHGDFPVTMPKFVASINYSERIGKREGPLKLMIYLPGEKEPSVVGEMPIEEIRKAPTPDVGQAQGLPEPEFRQLRVEAILSPLDLKAPGFIRAVAVCNGDTLELGRLRVLSANHGQ